MPQGCVKCIMSFELILSNTNYAPSSKERNTYRTYTSFNFTHFTHFISVASCRTKYIKMYQISQDDMIDWRCDDVTMWRLVRTSPASLGRLRGTSWRRSERCGHEFFLPSPVATGRNGSPSQRVAIIVALWWHFLGVIVCGPLANFSDDSAMRICLHLKSNRQMSSSNYSSRFGNRGAQSLLGQADHCGLLSDQHFSAARRQLGSGADSRQSSHAMLRCRQSSWIRRVLEVLEVLPACDANAMHSIWAFSTFSKEMNLQSAWICIQRSIHVYHVSSWRTTVTRSTYINIINIYCHYLPLFAYATYALKFHSAWISAGSSGSWPNEPQRRRSTCVQWKMWKRGWSIYLGGAVTGCG